MTPTSPKSYPTFEANQVLTHEQLNGLVAFLEREDRWTRTRVSGVGVACGLELWSDLTSRVIVSRGVGVTSAGDLALLEADAVFTHRRAYDDPTRYFQERGLSQALELLPTPTEPTPDVARLSDLPGVLSQRAVVAHVEQREEDLRSCLEIDCNEKGRRQLFTTRFLLVDAADADRLALPGDASLGMGLGLLTPPARPRDVAVPRPSLGAVHPPSYARLAQAFGVAIQQGRDRLGPALQTFLDALVPVLGAARPAPLLATLDAVIAAHRDAGVQYVYDWLRDLWQGYVELALATSRLRGVCCPDESWFPRHLLLGDLVDTSAPTYRAPRVPRAPSPRRFPFFPAPQVSGQEEARGEAALYLERLVLQLEGFAWSPTRSIAVTPEGGPSAPLARRAIAAYYRQSAALPNLRDHWSPEHTRLGWQAELRWFEQPASDLAHDAAAFFRVEGHLERPVGLVLEFLDAQVKTQALPFAVQAVSLDANVDAAALSRDCRWADLESAWTELRALWRCALEREVAFFADFASTPKKGLVKGVVARPQGFTDVTHVKVLDTGELFPVRPDGTYEVELPEGPWVLQAVSGTRAEGDAFFVDVAPDTTQEQPLSLKLERAPVTRGAAAVPYRRFLPQKPVKDYVGEWVGDAPIREAADRFDASGVLAGWAAANQAELVLTVGLPARLLLLLRATHELVGADLEAVDFSRLEGRVEAYLGAASELERQLVGQKLLTLSASKALLLQHAQAVKALCFLDAARALKATLTSRLAQQKRRLTLPDFLAQHPSLEHLGGVPRGGTFVLAYERGVVKADFALSYRCCDPCGAMVLKAGEALAPPPVLSETLSMESNPRTVTLPEAADPTGGLRVRAILTDGGVLAKLTFTERTLTVSAEEALFARDAFEVEYLLEEPSTGRTAIGKVVFTVLGPRPLPQPAELTVRTASTTDVVTVTPPAAAPSGVVIAEVTLAPPEVGGVAVRDDRKGFEFKPTPAFRELQRAEVTYRLSAGAGRPTVDGKVLVLLELRPRVLELEDVRAVITSLEAKVQLPLPLPLPLPPEPEDLRVTKLGLLDVDVGTLALLSPRGPVEYTPGRLRRAPETRGEVVVPYEVASEGTGQTGRGRLVLRFKLSRIPPIRLPERPERPERPDLRPRPEEDE